MDFNRLQGQSQTEVDFQTHFPTFLPILVALGGRVLGLPACVNYNSTLLLLRNNTRPMGGRPSLTSGGRLR